MYEEMKIPLDTQQLAVSDKLAEDSFRKELEHIRAVQAKLKTDKARRESEAQAADAERREAEQERTKSVVCNYFLNRYAMLTKEDFEASWETNKLAMIQEYQQFLSSAPQIF